jgi:hypothetical protein
VSSLGSIRGMTTFVIAGVALDVQLRSIMVPSPLLTRVVSATTAPPLLYHDKAAPELLNSTRDNISFDPLLGIPIASSRAIQSSPLVPPKDPKEDENDATDGSVENGEVQET